MAIIIDGNNTPTLGGVGYGDGTELAFTSAGSAGGVLYSAGGAAPVFSAAGTSGQFLTSAGAGAPTWTTVSSGSFGTDLSFKDYSLTLSSVLDASLGAPALQAVSLDGTSELFIISGGASVHAVVYNTSTDTFGTPALVRTGSFAGTSPIGIAKISSTKVLVCSLAYGDTALQTVVLDVSGSTITVGTPLATTLGAASALIQPNTRLVTVGSSYVLNYYTTANSLPKFRAITVSVSTPSIGSELAYAGGTTATMHHSYAHDASTLLHFSMIDNLRIYAFPIAVSGTTLTAGTQATVSITNATFMVTGVLSNSRYALHFVNTTGRGAVVSVAGSVATISTAATTMSVTSFAPTMQVFGNQAFIVNQSASDSVNVITDTSGTATLGTALAVVDAGNFVGYLSTSKVLFADTTAGDSTYYQYGISSGSPVLEKTFQTVSSTTVVTVQVPGTTTYSRPLAGPPQSGSGNQVMLRTSAGKIAPAYTDTRPFTVSIDGTNPAKLQQTANPFVAYNDAISEAVAWGPVNIQSTTSTTVQLRKVTLA